MKHTLIDKLFVVALWSIIAAGVLMCIRCGPPGPQGVQGPPGQPGSGCSVTTIAPNSAAPNGGSLVQCADTSSFILNGTNGTPGTVVAPVQFCPGTTSYPGEFNEVGFCINNQLYAVYSTKDGFMALIPPGVYDSDAVNSSCTFTVGTNCSISH